MVVTDDIGRQTGVAIAFAMGRTAKVESSRSRRSWCRWRFITCTCRADKRPCRGLREILGAKPGDPGGVPVGDAAGVSLNFNQARGCRRTGLSVTSASKSTGSGVPEEVEAMGIKPVNVRDVRTGRNRVHRRTVGTYQALRGLDRFRERWRHLMTFLARSRPAWGRGAGRARVRRGPAGRRHRVAAGAHARRPTRHPGCGSTSIPRRSRRRRTQSAGGRRGAGAPASTRPRSSPTTRTRPARGAARWSWIRLTGSAGVGGPSSATTSNTFPAPEHDAMGVR